MRTRDSQLRLYPHLVIHVHSCSNKFEVFIQIPLVKQFINIYLLFLFNLLLVSDIVFNFPIIMVLCYNYVPRWMPT
jgi:hypothetical protein